MFGVGDVTEVLIIAACLGSQYIFATRRHFLWGALLPVAFVNWRLYILWTTNSNIVEQLIIIGFGLLLLLGQWKQGRKWVDERDKHLEIFKGGIQ